MGYITYYNPVLGTIYLKSLTFVNAFPMDYSYEKAEGNLFDEYTFNNISKTFRGLRFSKI